MPKGFRSFALNYYRLERPRSWELEFYEKPYCEPDEAKYLKNRYDNGSQSRKDDPFS